MSIEYCWNFRMLAPLDLNKNVHLGKTAHSTNYAC